jgi:hypothetical protein
VPSPLELGSQLLVVVDFAVEKHVNASGLVSQWLGAAFHIDDRQSPHAQCDILMGPHMGSVWTAVFHR